MSSDTAIRVRDISKHYLMFDRPEDRLKQMIVPRIQRIARRNPNRYFRDFAALNGVSFDVSKGEMVGIVGRNGSGKSTMLQILCGTLQPTSGSVEVEGRIAALLELGSGFNPEFTGRENIYLNAAILGLSRSEVDARFDDIANFASIGMFIDQPVQTYSSGMYVRLAFAVAINVDADILVIDEALAVGDEAFQRKCFARIEEIREEGATILFVSHAAQTIMQLCNRAILFDRGEKILEGRPKVVVNQYQRLVSLDPVDAETVREEIKTIDASSGGSFPKGTSAFDRVEIDGVEQSDFQLPPPLAGNQRESWFDPKLVSQSSIDYERNGAIIHDVRIATPGGEVVNVLRMGEEYELVYNVDFTSAARMVVLNCVFRTPSGMVITGHASHPINSREGFTVDRATSIVARFRFKCSFLPGTYFGNVRASGRMAGEDTIMHRIADAFVFRVLPDSKLHAVGFYDAGIRFVGDMNSQKDA